MNGNSTRLILDKIKYLSIIQITVRSFNFGDGEKNVTTEMRRVFEFPKQKSNVEHTDLCCANLRNSFSGVFVWVCNEQLAPTATLAQERSDPSERFFVMIRDGLSRLRSR